MVVAEGVVEAPDDPVATLATAEAEEEATMQQRLEGAPVMAAMAELEVQALGLQALNRVAVEEVDVVEQVEMAATANASSPFGSPR